MKLIDLSTASAWGELSIKPGCLARLIPMRPLVLRCKEGELQVSIEGDPMDYRLTANEELLLPRGKLGLVEGNAAFFLRAGAGAGWRMLFLPSRFVRQWHFLRRRFQLERINEG